MKTCSVCKRPAEDGKTKCSSCAESARKTMRKRREKFKTLGLCTLCGKNKPVDGLTQCEQCRKRIRENSRKRYARRKKSNLCMDCGNDQRYKNQSLCKECYQRRKTYLSRTQRKTIRWSILERDNHTCQLCSSREKRLHIHHKFGDGQSEGSIRLDRVVDFSELDKEFTDSLITLCRSCHFTVTRTMFVHNQSLLIELIKLQNSK